MVGCLNPVLVRCAAAAGEESYEFNSDDGSDSGDGSYGSDGSDGSEYEDDEDDYEGDDDDYVRCGCPLRLPVRSLWCASSCVSA